MTDLLYVLTWKDKHEKINYRPYVGGIAATCS